MEACGVRGSWNVNVDPCQRYKRTRVSVLAGTNVFVLTGTNACVCQYWPVQTRARDSTGACQTKRHRRTHCTATRGFRI